MRAYRAIGELREIWIHEKASKFSDITYREQHHDITKLRTRAAACAHTLLRRMRAVRCVRRAALIMRSATSLTNAQQQKQAMAWHRGGIVHEERNLKQQTR